MSSTAQTSPSRPPSSKDPAEYTEAPEHELNSTAAQHIITEEKPQVATQYVTGVKLGLIVVMMGLACFLVLLDTMVISTVSLSSCLLRVLKSDLWLTKIFLSYRQLGDPTHNG